MCVLSRLLIARLFISLGGGGGVKRRSSGEHSVAHTRARGTRIGMPFFVVGCMNRVVPLSAKKRQHVNSTNSGTVSAQQVKNMST